MKGTQLEDWVRWAEEAYTMLPLARTYPLMTSRLTTWEPLWERTNGEAFVLESGKEGRYTFFGCEPAEVLRGKGQTSVLTDRQGVVKSTWYGKPLEIIKKWMAAYRSPYLPDYPKFCGGIIGFLGYDVVRSIERLPNTASDDLELPDVVMMRVERLWVIDHEEETLTCVVHQQLPEGRPYKPVLIAEWFTHAQHEAEAMKKQWDTFVMDQDTDGYDRQMRRVVEEDNLAIDPEKIGNVQRAFSREAYQQAVERIKQYISGGDAFQVNLSVRQSRRLSTRPEYIYEWLRRLNPSPYMSFLRLHDCRIASASPELLVQLEGGRIRTRPIAGTRRRGATPEEEERFRNELLHNEKEQAEHIMLVDLERNDLGRVSRYGTVKVTELMTIETYSHVMHLVSEVMGELADGRDAYDVIAATFPGGTITGAPKVRTMEIIEELEPVRRGPYTGSIGWIDYNGNMELNIVIRTLVEMGGTGFVQAGAGIVIDSVPEREYKESLSKAKALWKAIEYSEQYRAWDEQKKASSAGPIKEETADDTGH